MSSELTPLQIIKTDIQRETVDRIASFLGKCLERRPDDPVACAVATLLIGAGSTGAPKHEATAHTIAVLVYAADRMTNLDRDAHEDVEGLIDWTRRILDGSLEGMRSQNAVSRRALEVFQRRLAQ